jgi:hypothetical protein
MGVARLSDLPRGLHRAADGDVTTIQAAGGVEALLE